MPINPLYEPLAEQLMPAQRWLDSRDAVQDEQTNALASGMFQRAMQPPWQMVPSSPQPQVAPEAPIPSASPYIPTGLSQADIGAVQAARRSQRPEQRILGTLGGVEGTSGGELPAVDPARDYEPPQRDISGFGGLGNWDEVPMGNQTVGASSPTESVEPPQGEETIIAEAEGELSPQQAQTTFARTAQERGWDPRRLIAAMAQMSGDIGNIRGKPTPSSAPAYYQQMIGEEQQQRENDMKLEEMRMRYAPKALTESQRLDALYKQAMIDRLTAKTAGEPIEAEADRANKLALQNLRDEAALKIAGMRKQGMPAKATVPGNKPVSPEATFKNAAVLRKEYQSHPITKRTFEVQSAWEKAKAVLDSPSPAGDMAAIFMFMRTLDPQSTVREGEYKSAAEATSALGRVETYAKNVQQGRKLNDEQIKDFRAVMEKFYRAQMKEQGRLDKQYSDLATRSGVSPQDLLISTEEQPQGQPATKVKSIGELLGQ